MAGSAKNDGPMLGLYSVWQGMKQRCFNRNSASFKNYGGRGITVCDSWRHSFDQFSRDMGPRPPGLSIDRINNDGNYEPGNCRWADRVTQANNQRLGGFVKENAERTHCIHGHELSGDNVRITLRGRRECRACHRLRCVEHRQRAAEGIVIGRPTYHKPKKTHCIRGHEFTAENTNVYRGRQKCRTCNRERKRGQR